jgi:drug/metabolite transporter (DMT)-like permease
VTSAFAPLVPVNTAVMAGLLGQEQLTKRIVAGMALALSGTFSILHVETLGNELTTDRTGGILVLLFQNWTYAAYLVSLKQIMKSLPFPVGIYFGALTSSCGACVNACVLAQRPRCVCTVLQGATQFPK